jgi:hypothetical protein
LFARRNKLRHSPSALLSTLLAVVRFGLTLSLFIDPLFLDAQLATTEYRVKANFLAEVPEFVDWPVEALPPGQSPFLICILGDFSFGVPLGESVRGKTIRGKRVEVRGVRKDQELRSCHILFVSKFERKSYDRILDSVGGQNVLTIGETPEFLGAGGIIAFSMPRETLQFDVNLAAANKAHLRISSQLLTLARHVLNPTEAAKS